MTKVLFVCEGNAIRSQIAAAFLKHYAPGVDVASAGTYVPARFEGKPLREKTPNAVVAMKDIGFDIAHEPVHRLTPDMLEKADRVILMGVVRQGSTEMLRRHPRFEDWGVPDPGYGDVGVSEARDLIHEKVKALVRELNG